MSNSEEFEQLHHSIIVYVIQREHPRCQWFAKLNFPLLFLFTPLFSFFPPSVTISIPQPIPQNPRKKQDSPAFSAKMRRTREQGKKKQANIGIGMIHVLYEKIRAGIMGRLAR